jgi:hypothetical protein
VRTYDSVVSRLPGFLGEGELVTAASRRLEEFSAAEFRRPESI